MSTEAEQADQIERHLERASSLFGAGDPLGAAEVLSRILQQDPKHKVAAYNLALCYQIQGLNQQAIMAYEDALAISPKDVASLCNLGLLMEAEDRPHRALELFKRVLELDSKNLQALERIAYYRYQRGEWQLAKDALKEAKKVDDQDPRLLELEGLVAYGEGKYANAIEAYSLSLGQDNHSASVWNNLGNAHVKNAEIREAENAYRQAINLDDHNPDYWFNLGEMLFHYATKAEAIDPLKKVVELMPRDLEAWTLLARAQADARPADAEESFCQVLGLGGETQDLLKTLASLYRKNGEKEKEVDARVRLSKLNPYDMENNFAIAQIRLNQGQPEIAYKLLQDCLTISEKEYETWYRLAQNFQLERKLEEEFQCLEKVIKANPAHHAAWTRLGHVALQKDLPQKAFKYFFKAAPALKNDYSLWKLVMERLTEEKEWDMALECCGQVFELAVYSPRIWEDFFKHFRRIGEEPRFLFWLQGKLFDPQNTSAHALPFGAILVSCGKPDLALQLYQTLLNKNPSDRAAHYQLAEYYLGLNQPKEAAETARQGLKTHPNDYELVIALGEASYLEENYPEAGRTFNRALGLRRDDWRVWFNLGNVEARLDRPVEALKFYDVALDIYDQEPKTHFNRGLANRSVEAWDRAEQDFKNAVRLNRRYAAAWSALGALALRQNRLQAAKGHLLRALASSNRQHQVAWNNLAATFEALGDEAKRDQCLKEAEKN